jgi:uncharacterized protein YegP (UPF0339 family)
MHIELYQDQHNAWGWRAVATDNRVVCEGAETYTARSGAELAADAVVNGMRGAMRVIARERRTTQRDESTPAFDVIEIAEYQAEGELAHTEAS